LENNPLPSFPPWKGKEQQQPNITVIYSHFSMVEVGWHGRWFQMRTKTAIPVLKVVRPPFQLTHFIQCNRQKKRAGGTKWGALHYRQTWIIPVDSKARFLPTIQVQCFVEKDTYLISMGLSNEVKRSLFHSSLHWVSVYFFSKKNSVFFALGINLQRKFSVWKCAPQQKVLCEKC